MMPIKARVITVWRKVYVLRRKAPLRPSFPLFAVAKSLLARQSGRMGCTRARCSTCSTSEVVPISAFQHTTVGGSHDKAQIVLFNRPDCSDLARVEVGADHPQPNLRVFSSAERALGHNSKNARECCGRRVRKRRARLMAASTAGCTRVEAV
eukprot:6205494-Pleurochrysis_carterae.AAC.1